MKKELLLNFGMLEKGFATCADRVSMIGFHKLMIHVCEIIFILKKYPGPRLHFRAHCVPWAMFIVHP